MSKDDISPYEYRSTLLTYCDVLGFRSMIASSRSPQLIANILLSFQRNSGPLGLRDGVNFATFSDLIVRSVSAGESHGVIEMTTLLREIHAAAFAQSEIVRHGVFVRGAMTIGDMCTSKNFCFGPALIDAYETERHSAQFPRIVIAPALSKALEVFRHEPQGIDNISELLATDSDGLLFIDYLRARSLTCSDPCDYFDLLVLHREAVANAHKGIAAGDKSTIREKLDWLSSYHNRTVGSISERLLNDFALSRSNLLI